MQRSVIPIAEEFGRNWSFESEGEKYNEVLTKFYLDFAKIFAKDPALASLKIDPMQVISPDKGERLQDLIAKYEQSIGKESLRFRKIPDQFACIADNKYFLLFGVQKHLKGISKYSP